MLNIEKFQALIDKLKLFVLNFEPEPNGNFKNVTFTIFSNCWFLYINKKDINEKNDYICVDLMVTDNKYFLKPSISHVEFRRMEIIKDHILTETEFFNHEIIKKITDEEVEGMIVVIDEHIFKYFV